jgi:hypothetical protein
MNAGFDSIRPFSRLHSWGERRQSAGLFAYSPQKYCRDRLSAGGNRIRTSGPAPAKGFAGVPSSTRPGRRAAKSRATAERRCRTPAFLKAGPVVRIHFPPTESLRTLGPAILLFLFPGAARHEHRAVSSSWFRTGLTAGEGGFEIWVPPMNDVDPRRLSAN